VRDAGLIVSETQRDFMIKQQKLKSTFGTISLDTLKNTQLIDIDVIDYKLIAFDTKNIGYNISDLKLFNVHETVEIKSENRVILGHPAKTDVQSFNTYPFNKKSDIYT
jgi:hypothetical protein